MKIKALRAVLTQAAELYQTTGNDRVVAALRKFSEALAAHDAKTVDAFVKLVEKAGT